MRIVIIGLALAGALSACSVKEERTVQTPPATTTTAVPAGTTTVTTPIPPASTTTVYTR